MQDAPSFAKTHTALYLQSTRLTLSRAAVAKYMAAIMLRSAHILALQIYHTLPPHHANHAPCEMIMNAQYEASPPLHLAEKILSQLNPGKFLFGPTSYGLQGK